MAYQEKDGKLDMDAGSTNLLQEALTLAPDLREQSKSDPDLIALREQSA